MMRQSFGAIMALLASGSLASSLSELFNLKYAFPDPEDFKSRFYVAGGGGYSLNTDTTGGLKYGAAAGATDGGYDAFNYSFDEQFLLGNGSVNWDAIYMFSYQALREMT
ncbi:uncharacterized protein FIESC28_08182 [Fusarium coffeatum]|uniref:Carboxylic ester hydrolase n=1 Tax=Fusarium coffeatum TaxID=231269 RepID=A0A366R9C7_9HYPO|nr:uncharacterized protein FIESC28_08182 [Fusarium coffeatum]RBR13482.1 hypothetical protein FIESC28_08182 [Fusarium coffeatum]